LSHAFGILLLVSAASWAPAPLRAETPVTVGPFRSVTLRGGGKVILRHASEPRVNVRRGSTDVTHVEIVGRDRLVIDHPNGCPKGYELEIEVLTPGIDGLSVGDGGTIQSVGRFPRQAELRVSVHDGGTIDLRSMAVEAVDADVEDGGRILTSPGRDLTASIARGGQVIFWGSPNITSSVEDGGMVARGRAGDADKPLGELGPMAPPPPIPPVPAVPPVPPTRGRGTI
jgi:hypothetical protein